MNYRDRDFLGCGHGWGLASGGPNLKSTLLGKTPRYSPDRAADTIHVRLDLDIDFKKRSVAGACQTTVRAFRDGVSSLEFNAVDLKISSVQVGGAPARFAEKDGKLKVFIRRPLASGEEAKILVRYHLVEPKAGLHFVYPGPHNRANPLQLWSQSQPEDARYWYPCHDSPHEKTTSEVRAAVPEGFRLISNGVLVESSTQKGKAVFHWKMSQPHSIYLISIAAGRFAEIEDHWQDVPVTYYCEKGREADARRGFAKTPKAMEYFSDKIGVRYPYDKYAQVAVAEYPGGMENTTCTTQTDAILIDERAALDNDLDLLVAHELAHQWFGDLLTCRDWSHAWLNEGFATYFEVLFLAHDKGQDEADYELAQNAAAYFEEDARRYRRPIVCATYKFPWILFDRHTYEKGAWVLHMLRHELGEDLWWKSIGHYVRKFRDRSVETIDLIEAIAEATGRNLRPFFDQWVFKSGYPTFRVQYDWRPQGRKASLWILQTQDVNDESPLFKVPLEIRFSGRGWTKNFTEVIAGREERLTFTLPGEPLNIELDPNYRMLKKVAFQKPQAMWRHQLSSAASGRGRSEAAAHIGRWGDSAAVSLLARAVRREKFWGSAAEMVRALGAIGTDAAFREIKKLLKVRDPKVRRAAVDALGQFGRAEVGELLTRFARKDPSLNVEAQANRVLGSLRDPRHRSLLLANLEKRSYRDIIAAGAIGGLSASHDVSVLAALHKACRPPYGFYARVAAMRALAEFSATSRSVIPWICDLASDPDERITLAAIALLGQLEDERALPALTAFRKSRNSRIKVYAEEAIAKIRAGIEPKI